MNRETDGQSDVNEAPSASSLTVMISCFNITPRAILSRSTPYLCISRLCPRMEFGAANPPLNLCHLQIGVRVDYLRYGTDFSSESFGMYVGIIYPTDSLPS